VARKKKRWIQRAVKHPGRLTRAAERHGVSKREEAVRESHSSNPSTRARGILGLRFMKGGDIHRKGKRKLGRHKGRRMRRR
jgi:hypothetical protein